MGQTSRPARVLQDLPFAKREQADVDVGRMTPAQFLTRLERGEVAPAYLFIGPESYHRRRAREALLRAALHGAGDDNAIARYDLAGDSLAEVIDDARALSLFASERVIFAGNAEAVMPNAVAGEQAEESEGGAGAAAMLAAYMRNPTPGVVLVFDAPRFDFEGEDKRKQERVRKFYAALGEPVDFKRASPDEARREAAALARRVGLRIDPAAVDLLVESLAADLTRIAVEVEKLSLYAQGRTVTEEDVTLLAPEARATTIFALVAALGRRDRSRSLEILDTLFREGEYLPLALSFLAAQFRAALVAKEAGLRSPQQIQGHFARMGVQMWGSRAEQVFQTVAKFSKAQLERAIKLTFDADRDLRTARPDDRIVMEQFILRLTVEGGI